MTESIVNCYIRGEDYFFLCGLDCDILHIIYHIINNQFKVQNELSNVIWHGVTCIIDF